jgi:diguanylate cyclase (GGDEF)-like protein
LARVAARLRQGGEAFRLGGDEFALLLLPRRDEHEGLSIARSVLQRTSEAEIDLGETVSLSAGVAAYPQRGVERSELVRLADTALYAAKEQGKNTVRVYRPDVIEIAQLERCAGTQFDPGVVAAFKHEFDRPRLELVASESA